MKNTVIATLASAVTLALGMHSAMAADLKVNADSKIDKKAMQHMGTSSAPTPGWEKLSKNKNWKPAGSGTNQYHPDQMKQESKIVPEHQLNNGISMSHDGKGKSETRSQEHKSGMSDKGHSEHMKSGAAKPAGQAGVIPMQHGS